MTFKDSVAMREQSRPLCEADKQVYDLLRREEARQAQGLELIASENFTSRAVMEAVGSAFTNKYSEGLPGARYYGGNEVIDELERLTQERALAAFSLSADEWGVNVQPYSGSIANLAAFSAVLQPHDRVMGLDLPSGGHLSHGFYRGHTPVNASSLFFESLPYKVSPETGLVDYDALESLAKLFQPKLLIAGGSAYPRDWDYARMRTIADSTKALLLTDMAHYSGLVAGNVVKSPFEYSDLVTSTTHKSLRGPRAALIFYRLKPLNPALQDHFDLRKRVNNAVFPLLQGGPHNNAIAGICVQLAEVATPQFAEYANQVVKNARTLAAALEKKGYVMCTGGTDTHLVLWDLRPQGLTGSKVEALCDAIHITVNKNSVFGDASAMTPGGVRLGAPALTSRGFLEKDFEKVADFLDQAVKLSLKIQSEVNSRQLVDFKKAISGRSDVAALAEEVIAFSNTFYMPAFDVDRKE